MVRFFGLLLLIAGMLNLTPKTSAQEVAATEAIQTLVVKFYDISPLVTHPLHHRFSDGSSGVTGVDAGLIGGGQGGFGGGQAGGGGGGGFFNVPAEPVQMGGGGFGGGGSSEGNNIGQSGGAGVRFFCLWWEQYRR
jgi:hypothetical protein